MALTKFTGFTEQERDKTPSCLTLPPLGRCDSHPSSRPPVLWTADTRSVSPCPRYFCPFLFRGAKLQTSTVAIFSLFPRITGGGFHNSHKRHRHWRHHVTTGNAESVQNSIHLFTYFIDEALAEMHLLIFFKRVKPNSSGQNYIKLNI